jgi:retron-type reverse transcriptase
MYKYMWINYMITECYINFFSGEAVNKRLHALKTQYARICKPAPSGSGTVNKTSRQQWLMSKLQFLKTFMKTRPSTSNLTVQSF